MHVLAAFSVMAACKRDVTIRAAGLADAPEITRLAAQLGYRMSSSEMERRLRRLLADSRHHITVAADTTGQLSGWLHVEHRTSLKGGERVELMGLVVASTARRQGIGRKLVNAVESWALTRGVSQLTVRSNAERESSHPFYEALGYVRGKSQHVYFKAVTPARSAGERADD